LTKTSKIRPEFIVMRLLGSILILRRNRTLSQHHVGYAKNMQRFHVQPFWHKSRVWRTDGRTDRHIIDTAIAYTAVALYSWSFMSISSYAIFLAQPAGGTASLFFRFVYSRCCIGV